MNIKIGRWEFDTDKPRIIDVMIIGTIAVIIVLLLIFLVAKYFTIILLLAFVARLGFLAYCLGMVVIEYLNLHWE